MNCIPIIREFIVGIFAFVIANILNNNYLLIKVDGKSTLMKWFRICISSQCKNGGLKDIWIRMAMGDC